MILRYRSNLCAGIAGIVFGAVLYFLIPVYIGTEYGVEDMITSRTMPYAVAIISMLCGAALVFQSIVLKKDTVKQVELGKEVKALFYMVILAVYCLTFQYGFIATTAGIGVATLIFSRSKRIYHYVIVIGTVLLLYWVFTSVLYVRLP